jgi:OTU domain-containing protein 6
MSLEELQEKQRKEKKDLQSKIQSLKKSVPKGDRKKKKEIDLEVEKLENDFENKCKLELEEFQTQSKKLNESSELGKQQDDLSFYKEKEIKGSKTKKRREKKDHEESKRNELIEKQKIENLKGPAHIEITRIKEKLKSRNLVIKDVLSDGNCMYYSIADQLKTQFSLTKTCEELRELTCNHMLAHQFDFQPYLCSEDDDGDMLDDEKFHEYCMKIKDTLVWGSQLELKALADALKIQIEVVQAEGPELLIGETSHDKARCIITYHRHMFGSGEHYNSTESANNTEHEDE